VECRCAVVVVLALFAAVSMVAVTTGFGAPLGWIPVGGAVSTAVPALGLAGVGFGV
jgi:hypothetical protein